MLAELLKRSDDFWKGKWKRCGEKLGAIGQAIYTRLGVKTGKEKIETLPLPTGTVIVAALCSLARRGQELQEVQQFGDGCLLEAKLPSDIWSFEGRLLVTVRGSGESTEVAGATSIQGQAFDWGKSSRCLQALFRDIQEVAI